MSPHIFLSLMSDMVALCTPYSAAKSFPKHPFSNRSLISRTVAAVKIAPGFNRFALCISSVVGQPCLPCTHERDLPLTKSGTLFMEMPYFCEMSA